MIFSNAFNYVNVLHKAADASYQRQGLIMNNIANVSTPGYKRKDLQFEQLLMMQLAGGDSLDSMINNTDLTTLNGVQFIDNMGLSYRLDKNNVDIDTEEAALAKNQIKYNFLLESMSAEFSRLRMAIGK